MKKTVYILNLILFAVMIALDVLLILTPSLAFKSGASACFVAAGIVNLVYAVRSKSKITFPVLMLLGFVFAMAGDIAIYNKQ